MEINDPVWYAEIARRAVAEGIAPSMTRQRVMQLHRGTKSKPADPNFPEHKTTWPPGNTKIFEWAEVRQYLIERETRSGHKKGWK